MGTEYDYQNDCDNIDEVQKEDRQERMKIEKEKAGHLRYLRNKEKTANADTASLGEKQ